MVSSTQTSPPPLAARMRSITDHVVFDLFGGPRHLKFAWVVNFQKTGTFLFLGFLIWWYGNESPAAWIYLGLHGSYGLIWLLKDLTFPDPSWQRRCTWAGALAAFLGVLGPYWLIGWLLISGVSQPVYPLPDVAWFMLCITTHTLGVAIMIAADCQKYYTLRIRRGLIDDGMFRYVRHPNYLGEMLIYGSYALMVWHWLPWLILGWVWLGLFAVNMVMKEASMSRYADWAAYRARSGMLLPPPGALFKRHSS